MGTHAYGWFAQAGGGALKKAELLVPDPGPDEVVLKVLACGLCHTDLGYSSAAVTPKHALPLVLGHEIVGTVMQAGERMTALQGRNVLVPAVLPCGQCALCKMGRGNACPAQKMPGNDVHGGFASHVLLPGAPLLALDSSFSGPGLRALSVAADAVSTAWQALLRAGVQRGDVCVVVGAGGVGGFAVQMASALGAHVLALDVSEARLALMKDHGAERTLTLSGDDVKGPKKAVQEFARKVEVPSWRWRILECSGTAAGQGLAWNLMGHACRVVFVGFTMDRVPVRLSNLMAFDAEAHGSWGCAPEHFPEVLNMVKDGRVRLQPFIEEASMERINEFLDAMAAHQLQRRMVLTPAT